MNIAEHKIDNDSKSTDILNKNVSINEYSIFDKEIAY
jgi:hypothetical protein